MLNYGASSVNMFCSEAFAIPSSSGDLKAINIERVKEVLAQVEERNRVYERNAERVISQSLEPIAKHEGKKMYFGVLH